jgi:thioredoxin-related protein
MKKLIIFLSVFLFAFEVGKVNWLRDYKEAEKLALRENKIIMVDISKHNCPPCIYMEKKVYSNEKVAKYIQKNFIPLFYYADTDKIPFFPIGQYFTEVAPSILFIDKNGNLVYRVIGPREAREFLKILKKIKDEHG